SAGWEPSWAAGRWERGWRWAGRTGWRCVRGGYGSSPWRTWCSTRWTTTRRADYVSPPHEPPPLQHADAAGGAVRAAGAAAGYDVHLRPAGVELRAHRKFPDVPGRGSAAPAPR